ncbi:hypothetical protein Trydic_g22165 [Trypoxylus dichotomus]
MSCSAPGCSNSRRFKPENVSFHTFPRGELMKTWLRILGKNPETWMWSKNKLVCSLHFKEADYMLKDKKKILKMNVVPSVAINGENGCSELKASTSIEALENSISTSISSLNHRSLMSSREIINLAIQKRKLSKIRRTAMDLRKPAASSNSSAKRRKFAFIKSMHNYSIPSLKITSRICSLLNKHSQYRRRLYRARHKIIALQMKVANLKVLIDNLKREHLSEYERYSMQRNDGNLLHLTGLKHLV